MSIYVSPDNSSTTPLLNGESFIGEPDKIPYSSAMVSIATDQSLVLYMEFSSDGVNWDESQEFILDNPLATDNLPVVCLRAGRYYRTRVLNNSGFDQTYFRLETTYGDFGGSKASVPSRSDDDIANINEKIQQDAENNILVSNQMEVGVGSGLVGYTHQRCTDEGCLCIVPRCTSQALPDGASNIQELPKSCTGGYVVQPAFSYVFNGSTWDKLRGSEDGIIINNKSYGSQYNGGNNVSIGPLAVSSSVDTTKINKVVILYQDSNTGLFDSVKVEGSIDGVNFLEMFELFLTDNGSIRFSYYNFDGHGINSIRLLNNSGVTTINNAYISIVGTNF